MNAISVPAEAVTIYNAALESSNRGDFAKALAEYKRAIEIHPEFIEAFSNIGEIHARMGNSDLALDAYKQALKIEKNYRVLLNLGVEYYNIKKYDEALSYFMESLQLKPDFMEGNYYAGMTLYAVKQYKEAEVFLARVIKVDKQHLKANYLLSYIYYEWKEYAKVITCLDNIKDISDDKIFLNKYYGFCYYYLGDYKKAVSYLQDALKAQPQYKKFKNYLKGLTYENKVKEIGDVDSAIKEMEAKMMGDEPVYSDVSRLSMLYIFQGQNQKAEELLLNYKAQMAS